ncbi:hypothetical protein CF319_g6084 [Tilletia indica]|nr:hypothetical protein CF319_g6084 [Tilletia indica]
MARIRTGMMDASGSSSTNSSPGSAVAHLINRIQHSPSLFLATTSATSLIVFYVLFPHSTRSFFTRLLPGNSSSSDDDGSSNGTSASAKKNKKARQRAQAQAQARAAAEQSDGISSSSPAPQPAQIQHAPQPNTHRPASNNCCAVFWDVDNCAPPSGMSGRDVALAIRKAIQDLIPPGTSEPIIVFKAYLELSSETAISPAQVSLRSELQGSGVSLIDTPKSGRKQVADQMMITDLLAFAIDHPAPARIVLMSGDRDFAYPIGTLRNRGFFITLITPPAHVAPILEASAHVVLRWRQDVLGIDYDKDGKPYTGTRALKPGTPLASVNPPSTLSRSQSKSTADLSATTTTTATATPRKANQAASTTLSSNGKPIPAVFKPLVDLLEQMRKQGQSRPLRSGVAAQLRQVDKDLFERAGASRWAEYAAVAEAAGIITLGSTGVSGHEWVSLAGAEDEGNKNAQLPASPSMAKTRAAPLYIAAGASSFAGNKMAGPPQTPTKSIPSSSSASAIYQSATAPKLDTPELRPFLPLIEMMNSQRSIGIPLPRISYISKSFDRMITQGVVDPYRQAGVSNFTQYLAAAERGGVARAQGDAVKLHPRYIGVQTSAVTPSIGRMEDTAYVPPPATPNRSTAALGALNKANALASSIKSKVASTFNSSSKLSEEEIRATLYKGLIECLREQRAEKHFYSADFFIQLVLGKLPGGEGLGRNVDLFNVFLDEAERDGVVMLEPGFGHGRRHVRLAPAWFEAEHAAERLGGDVLPVAGFELPNRQLQQQQQQPGVAGALKNGVHEVVEEEEEEKEEEKEEKEEGGGITSMIPPILMRGMLPVQETIKAAVGTVFGTDETESPTKNGSSSEAYTTTTTATISSSSDGTDKAGSSSSAPPAAAAASGQAAERARYKPLVDALIHLRREYQIVYPSMEQLHAELRDRSASLHLHLGGTNTMGLGNGTGEASPHSIEFVQWLSGAADLGLVVIERYEDEEDGGVGKARLRLADRYVEMFKL